MQIRCNFPDISYLSETQKNNFQFLIKTVGVQVRIHIYYYKQDQDKYVRERTRTAGED